MRAYSRISLTIFALVTYLVFSCNTAKHTENNEQEQPAISTTTNTYLPILNDTAQPISYQPKKIKTTVTTSTSKSIFNATDIPVQHFKFKGSEGKLIETPSGMRIVIPQNAFVDEYGNVITDEIDFELKEAIKADAIVLGNLTTTYYGMYLESGGMFCTNALANGKQLKIANGKSLAFEVPTTSYKDDMMIFNGEQKNAEIKWQNPDTMDEQKAALAFVRLEPPVYRYHIWHTNGYWIGSLPFSTTQQITKAIKKTLREHPLTTDTIIKVWHYDIMVMRLLDSNAKPIVKRAFNTYRQDEKTSYLFTTNNLGWANIDRLFNDPRTKKC